MSVATNPSGQARTTSTRVAEVPDTPMTPLPSSWRSLPRAFIRSARENWDRLAMTDTTGARLSFGETLQRALAMGRVLGRSLGKEPYIGLLLPPTVPGAVANLALAMWGKIAVNLNYTAGQEVLDSSIAQCGITQVITSQRFLSKLPVQPPEGVARILLEEIPRKVRPADRAFAGAVASLVPGPMLGAFLPGLRVESHETTATVIFTSGSTGDPKGVVLSHGNILSNVHQILHHIELYGPETLLGILPYFHSFGYTVTLWTALCLGKTAVYHFNPLDARIVGNLCQEHGVTLIAASPTFMRTYVKKCDREQFASVRHTILGAEKLKPELAVEIRERLGIEPLEAYGCTETGPGVAANVHVRKRNRHGEWVSGNRPGTVGLLFPGTLVKTTDPETGAELPRGVEGIVHVKGPQIMKGYLKRPEQTARVLVDGWYNTGDLGFQDDDGFLTITGRISRFSKVGGEMVPHERVESAILVASASDHAHVAVSAVPDAHRGERLVVLYDDLGMTPLELYRKLLGGPLPKLWLPSADDFVKVEAIPVLGTGKVDLREVRRIAEQHARG